MNQTRYLTNSSGNQLVQVCLNQSSQVDLVTCYIKDGLLNGEAVIVIAKPTLRKILKSKIDGFSFDGQAMQDQNQIKFFDADFLLSNLMFEGDLEEKAFQEYIVAPMYTAQLNYPKVRAFSEMVDILWKQNQHNKAIQLEVFWNNLSNTKEFSFLCTYSLDKLNPDSFEDALERICNYHSQLIPMEDNSTEHRMGEAMLNIFGAAWNRVINKPANYQGTPGQIQFSPILI